MNVQKIILFILIFTFLCYLFFLKQIATNIRQNPSDVKQFALKCKNRVQINYVRI